MPTVYLWPPVPPADLAGLPAELERRLPTGTVLEAASDPVALPSGVGDALVLVVVESDALSVLTTHLAADALDVVVVTPDSFLGSDSADLGPALAGGAAVAAVRSKATRRGARHRANVVAAPAALLGPPPTQRGPLAHVSGVADIAEATAFLLDPDNTYLNGQVLQVNGGRHLFSSHTA